MNKIIGFLITKQKSSVNIDFFNYGLKVFEIIHSSYFIYLWGIGEISKCKVGNKYCLAFPLNNTLLDRNVLISLNDGQIIIENDWLGSIPIFYNPKEMTVSTLVNFCVKEKKIHNEGLANFCEFGYSVFSQTMFENVKFMRYYSKLTLNNEAINIEYKDDPVLNLDFLTYSTSVEEVISKMKDYINTIENNIPGEIIIPTSGGLDSRMLNYLIRDKSRIRSFTYGVSKDQTKCHEVVNARKISEILNTKWEHVLLDHFNEYINTWFNIFGISTHLHGMYHIEFYSKILTKHKFTNCTLLSGIVGDLWAQSGKFKSINNSKKLINLGYTHGLNLDSKYIRVPFSNELKQKVFLEIGKYVKNDKIRTVFGIRTKLILLSYLLIIPEYFAIPVWTPFLNFDIARMTLSLPDELRKKRRWVRDFFKNVSLNIEDMNLKSLKDNSLDYEIAKKHTFDPIDIKILSEYIQESRLKEINNILSSGKPTNFFIEKILNVPKLGGILRRLGFQNENDYVLRALYDYYVIKVIELGLKYDF